MHHFDIAMSKRPILSLKHTGICGDNYFCKQDDMHLHVCLFDGAGHGLLASRVADNAIEFVENNLHISCVERIKDLHDRLTGTSGGVIALCQVHKDSSLMTYSGAGNISTRVFRAKLDKSFVSPDGLIGHRVTRFKSEDFQMIQGDTLIMHSDGVSNRFGADDIPFFYHMNSQDLCDIIMARYARADDDASCIVVKVYND